MRKKIFYILLLVIASNPCYAQDSIITLSAHMQGKIAMWDGTEIDTWGFIEFGGLDANILPSPTLEFIEGDSVQLNMDNASEMSHTVHLHGLDVNQQNDGVPATSFVIPGWGYNSYYFKAKNAGTFLYHCHFETVIHLQMGMFGAIIVRPKEGANFVYDSEHRFTSEYLWLASEVDSRWHEQVFENGKQPSTYLPDYFLVNGKSEQQIAEDKSTAVNASIGDTVLLRVANMGYQIHRYIFPSALNANAIGSDGRKFKLPEKTDTLYVYPGERYAVLIKSDDQLTDNVSLEYLENYLLKISGTQTIPVHFSETIPGKALINKNNSFAFSYNKYQHSLELTFVRPSRKTINIYNLNGVQLIHAESMAYNESIQLKNISAGLYLVQVKEGNTVFTRKVFLP